MIPKILFVDDEAHMREILSLYLRGNGMEVSLAANVLQATDLLETASFDLTILDLNLAGEDGLDVLQFIKTKWPTHPVIIFTGISDDELFIKKALAGRADGFVRKMSGLAGVLAAVRQLLPESSAQGAGHQAPRP
jgi:two-component system OmpR family response regulator